MAQLKTVDLMCLQVRGGGGFKRSSLESYASTETEVPSVKTHTAQCGNGAHGGVPTVPSVEAREDAGDHGALETRMNGIDQLLLGVGTPPNFAESVRLTYVP
jgi:hypothetical protein